MSDRYISVEGVEVPRVGFGTYQMTGKECFSAVLSALEAGYRHFDTAMKYDNEEMIADAIEESGVDRDEIFLTTKVNGPPYLMVRDDIVEAARGSLRRLDTSYVDLLLVHWWSQEGDMGEFAGAVNHLVEENEVRYFGVSNFSTDQLRRMMDRSDHPIFTNQFEYHPYLIRDELIEFCRDEDVLITAYSPLGRRLVLDDSTLRRIGDRYGKSTAQVSIRWLIQQENVITIPKSATKSRIVENYDVFDFELTPSEVEAIRRTRGPLRYELTKQGGPIPRLTGFVGPKLPGPVKSHVIPTVSKLARSTLGRGGGE